MASGIKSKNYIDATDVVLERVDSVPEGSKLPTCMSGAAYNIKGLAVNDVGSLPAEWDMVGRRYPVIMKELQPGAKVKSEPGSMLTMGNNVTMSTGLKCLRK